MENLEIPLQILNELPESCDSLELHNIRLSFPHPTLIDIPGKKPEALFISLLLHGNELTSFHILKRLYLYFKEQKPTRRIILFVGNVYATEQNKRFLKGQNDYNRIWKKGFSREHQLAEKVKNYVKNLCLFANIDIHNNTGVNPFYSCINRLDESSIYLAQLFSRTIVYFQTPDTVQATAFSEFCPSVTLECGHSQQLQGTEKAFQFIVDVLNHESLQRTTSKTDTDIFETVAKISLPNNLTFSFNNCESDLSFSEDFEKLNFNQLNEGYVFATAKYKEKLFSVSNEQGDEVFNQYFHWHDGIIYVRKPFIPSMLTKNKEVIMQDCLGYIMRRVSF